MGITLPRATRSRAALQALLVAIAALVVDLRERLPEGEEFNPRLPLPEWPIAGRADLEPEWILGYLNGTGYQSGWLAYVERTIGALAEPERVSGDHLAIARLGGDLMTTAWDYLNQLGRSGSRLAGEAVYRPLEFPPALSSPASEQERPRKSRKVRSVE